VALNILEKARNFEENALDRSLWSTRFGRDCGPVVRHTTWRRCVSQMPVLSPTLCRLRTKNVPQEPEVYVPYFCWWHL